MGRAGEGIKLSHKSGWKPWRKFLEAFVRGLGVSLPNQEMSCTAECHLTLLSWAHLPSSTPSQAKCICGVHIISSDSHLRPPGASSFTQPVAHHRNHIWLELGQHMGPCFNLGLLCMPLPAIPASPPLPPRLTDLPPGVAVGWGVALLYRPGNLTGMTLPTCLPTHWENSFCVLDPQAQDKESPTVSQLSSAAAWRCANLVE